MSKDTLTHTISSRRPSRQISFKERQLIEFLYHKKTAVSQIAQELGFHRPSIYRELNHGYVIQFDNDSFDLGDCGEVTYLKKINNQQEGFHWDSSGNEEEYYLKWRKKAGKNLCLYIGGTLSQNYSWFFPCRKGLFMQSVQFINIKKRLFVLLEIMHKQFLAYRKLSDFVRNINKDDKWEVLLWEYDAAFIQSKKNEK